MPVHAGTLALATSGADERVLGVEKTHQRSKFWAQIGGTSQGHHHAVAIHAVDRDASAPTQARQGSSGTTCVGSRKILKGQVLGAERRDIAMPSPRSRHPRSRPRRATRPGTLADPVLANRHDVGAGLGTHQQLASAPTQPDGTGPVLRGQSCRWPRGGSRSARKGLVPVRGRRCATRVQSPEQLLALGEGSSAALNARIQIPSVYA